KPAPDAFGDEHYVGYYHLSFDLSDLLAQTQQDLPTWLESLCQQFEQAAAENPPQISPLKVLLDPEQQQIGDRLYEVAFIADSDGLPLEFLRELRTLG
ncbi:MAG: VOC family protein, partial [Phormidium sp. GEM2.Bin31]